MLDLFRAHTRRFDSNFSHNFKSYFDHKTNPESGQNIFLFEKQIDRNPDIFHNIFFEIYVSFSQYMNFNNQHTNLSETPETRIHSSRASVMAVDKAFAG